MADASDIAEAVYPGSIPGVASNNFKYLGSVSKVMKREQSDARAA